MVENVGPRLGDEKIFFERPRLVAYPSAWQSGILRYQGARRSEPTLDLTKSLGVFK